MARAAGLSNKGSRQTLAGLSLDEEMDSGCHHPRALLDESSGPTSGTKRNWPQSKNENSSAVGFYPCSSVFICGQTCAARGTAQRAEPWSKDQGLASPAIFHLARNEHSPQCLRLRDEENVAGFAKVPLAFRFEVRASDARPRSHISGVAHRNRRIRKRLAATRWISGTRLYRTHRSVSGSRPIRECRADGKPASSTA